MRLEVLLTWLTFVLASADNSGVRELGNGTCRLEWRISRIVAVQSVSARRVGRLKIIEEPHHIDFCCSGYHKVGHLDDFDSGGFRCDPVCEPRCQGSTCTAPGHCECLPGYSRVSSSRCVPQCTPKCVNSTCGFANTCTCLEGFKATEETHACEPHCPLLCVNADCVSPNVCRCKEGFEQTSPNFCEPVCSLECESGFCSAPDTCSCFAGFTVNEDNWNVCDPYCSQGCTNALCTSPEVCSCLSGFEKAKDNDTECEPVCSKPCVNAECVAPNECACSDGYVNDTRNNCVPFCSVDCGAHGDCVSPETCDCHDGYYGASCEPRCPGGCVNGVCSRPGFCSCPDGFLKVNQTHCQSLCSDESDNCRDTSNFEYTGDFSLINNSIHLPEHAQLKIDFCNSINDHFPLSCFAQTETNETTISVNCWLDETLLSEQNFTQNNFTNPIKSLNFTFVYPQNLTNEFTCDICLNSSSVLKLDEATILQVSRCPHKPLAVDQGPSSNLLVVFSISTLGLIFVGSCFVVIFICSRQITSYKVQEFEERRRVSETSEGGQVALMDSFHTNDDCDEEFEETD